MEILTDYHTLLLIIAIVSAFFMAWGIGANDVANAMATSVGSKALTVKHAIIVAAIFEFAGTYLAGGHVTATIRKGIIDTSMLQGHLDVLVIGMIAALLAAGSWLLIATSRGWPVSTTHSIVGAIIGFGVAGLGVHAIHWRTVGEISASWVTSPIIAGVISFLLYTSVKKLILERDDVYHAAVRYVPIYMFMVGFIIAMVTMMKGLAHIGLKLNDWEAFISSIVVASATASVGKFFLRRIDRFTHHGKDHHPVERVFGVLMIFTACSMAFAHGSNDVANAIGPLAAVYSTLQSGGAAIAAKTALPSWILLLGGVGIVLGLSTYGFKVMATVGQQITELTPSRGFAAELSAATTVVVASGIGMPISTTQTLVGAVIGVGLAHKRSEVHWKVLKGVFWSWLITIPIGALLAIVYFYSLNALFSL